MIHFVEDYNWRHPSELIFNLIQIHRASILFLYYFCIFYTEILMNNCVYLHGFAFTLNTSLLCQPKMPRSNDILLAMSTPTTKSWCQIPFSIKKSSFEKPLMLRLGHKIYKTCREHLTVPGSKECSKNLKLNQKIINLPRGTGDDI